MLLRGYTGDSDMRLTFLNFDPKPKNIEWFADVILFYF